MEPLLNVTVNTPLNNSARPKRVTHTISFKLDVCQYLRQVPGATVAGCARHFHIREKQVRYFRKREDSYRSIRCRRERRNFMRPEQIRMRAMYADQEHNVFNWFLQSRADGKNILA